MKLAYARKGGADSALSCGAASLDAEGTLFGAGYMQMSGEQEAAWAQDVNQFIADEDELLFAARTSGCLLLDELFSGFAAKAAAALSAAISARFKEAEQLKVRFGCIVARYQNGAKTGIRSFPSEYCASIISSLHLPSANNTGSQSEVLSRLKIASIGGS